MGATTEGAEGASVWDTAELGASVRFTRPAYARTPRAPQVRSWAAPLPSKGEFVLPGLC
ncbi:hypothetical protein FM113_04530 [Leucobacter sp. 7(1)]|nr:hypothetical protein FM113_04530 [Leucobacter sp. 7(1)]